MTEPYDAMDSKPTDAVKSCGSCRFSTPGIGVDNKIDFHVRTCKWGPPTPHLVQTNQGMQVMNVYPTMRAADWCHRFEAKLQ